MHVVMPVLILLLTMLFLMSYAQQGEFVERADPDLFIYQNGDILFQDLDCGPLCDAIESVTQGPGGSSFSHLGLVHISADGVHVIEAIGTCVQRTPLHRFLERSLDVEGNPKILVGRLKEPYIGLIPEALQYALLQIGVPYDDAFLYGNGRYYCSELIHDAFMAANRDEPFFQLSPMTFMDPATGKTHPVWEEYFEKLGMAVPEGALGCNPAGISTDHRLRAVARFY